MKCKKFKEKIILHLYGELNEKEGAELENHIKKCTECSQDFLYTKKVFKALDDAKEEEPEADWEKCWQGIDTHVPEKTRRKRSPFLSPQWVYAAATLLIVFVLGAIFGRYLFFPAQESSLQPVISQNSMDLALKEYFEEIKPILIEYANYTSSNGEETTIVLDKEVVNNLLIQNFLLKDIITKTNPSLVPFMEDLDIVLREVSNLKRGDIQTPSLIKELIHEREILFKMEILQKI